MFESNLVYRVSFHTARPGLCRETLFQTNKQTNTTTTTTKTPFSKKKLQRSKFNQEVKDVSMKIVKL